VKVFLRDIPYEGLEVSQTVSAQEIGLAGEDFTCLSSLSIDAVFEKVDMEILADITVKGSYEITCSRCLEPVRFIDRVDDFELAFDINPQTEFVEYGDDIRQELLIALSGVVRCSEECKGLCKSCGVNLNKEKCRCKK